MLNYRNLILFLLASIAAINGLSGIVSANVDQSPSPRKTWDFTVEGGTVEIQLIVYLSPPKSSSLNIVYAGEPHPSLYQEVGFLRDVVSQLPALGVEPRDVQTISMVGFVEPEVRRRVAIAALHSKEWQSFTTVKGGAERVVTDLLNSLGVYDSVANAFGSEVTARVKGVEKVGSSKCMDVKLSDPDCNPRHNPRVPVGANIYLEIVKKD